jgi:hypothetical protein
MSVLENRQAQDFATEAIEKMRDRWSDNWREAVTDSPIVHHRVWTWIWRPDSLLDPFADTP